MMNNHNKSINNELRRASKWTIPYAIPRIFAILLVMDQQQPGMTAQSDGRSTEDAQQNRDIAALSYVWILSLVTYFAKRDSAYVRFHARQGIVLFILSILVWMIPYVGRLLEIGVLILAVLGFLNAAQGQWGELPLVGPLARRDVKGLRGSWKDLVDASVRVWARIRATKAASPSSPAPMQPTSSVSPPPPSPPPPPPRQ